MAATHIHTEADCYPFLGAMVVTEVNQELTHKTIAQTSMFTSVKHFRAKALKNTAFFGQFLTVCKGFHFRKFYSENLSYQCGKVT